MDIIRFGFGVVGLVVSDTDANCLDKESDGVQPPGCRTPT